MAMDEAMKKLERRVEVLQTCWQQSLETSRNDTNVLREKLTKIQQRLNILESQQEMVMQRASLNLEAALEDVWPRIKMLAEDTLIQRMAGCEEAIREMTDRSLSAARKCWKACQECHAQVEGFSAEALKRMKAQQAWLTDARTACLAAKDETLFWQQSHRGDFNKLENEMVQLLDKARCLADQLQSWTARIKPATYERPSSAEVAAALEKSRVAARAQRALGESRVRSLSRDIEEAQARAATKRSASADERLVHEISAAQMAARARNRPSTPRVRQRSEPPSSVFLNKGSWW
jgi:hypothetical protein